VKRWAYTLSLPILAVATGGCARRTDAENRAAFEAATQPSKAPDARRPDRPGRRPRPTPGDPRTAWQSLGDLLERSITLLDTDVEQAAFIATATGWCAVKPEPRMTRTGLTYLCFPREGLSIGRRSFTLEVSPNGVIGLHIDELDEATSKALADQARAAVAGLCATAFAPTPAEDEASRSFQTCPVDGGSTLAVGHARSTVGPGWFVTITVLGEVRAKPP
jgi:hypothetical protein